MPKAGKYDYPQRDLDSCVGCLNDAYKIAMNYNFKRANFASALKMSPTSGGFGMLVSSMGMYGLIETGGGDLQYTDLAKVIIHGKGKEKEEAMEKAVRNVPIFSEIYDRYGNSWTDDQLEHFLRDKANLEIGEANKLAPEIGKLLKKVSPYLTPSNRINMETEEEGGVKKVIGENENEASLSYSGNILGELRTKDYGVLKLTDELSLTIASQIVNGLRDKMKASKPREETPENNVS